ncbi:MAG: acyl-CoA dehydrogenase family protein [Candidatus Krumholzibacteriota bacterium]|nr:acyl-CoA dehydrogenase family protein [Candidatus Krumholzibacteriota bacterium]
MSFKALDFFNLDELLSEEEILVRETAAKFVDREVIPVIADHWEKATFPKELIPMMGELGFLGPFVPAEYGGAECSYTIYGLICQELERGDSGVRSFASVQGSLVMYPIWKFGSEEQKKKYLPELAAGKIVGCFGLTEPDAGSDPRSMLTRAKKDKGDWVLNGTKMWITNGSIADIAVVWAKDEEGKIRGFIVHSDDPGFSSPEQKHKVSLRASVTSELILEDVRIPADRELPGTDDLKSPLMCLTSARYGIAWGATGALQSVFDEVLGYTSERVQFNKPVASFQITQSKLAELATDLTNCQLMGHRLGRLADSGRMKHYHVSMAKRHNVNAALQGARKARGMLGANGITLEYQTMRHMCNLESVHTYEGTFEIHTLIIGEHLTGMSAFGNE